MRVSKKQPVVCLNRDDDDSNSFDESFTLNSGVDGEDNNNMSNSWVGTEGAFADKAGSVLE